ncbi:NAD(P)-binding protein [Dentipellis sp. KUC8613]|nr:NAD(P)-binding protein [Dentipellis sp. KUC8613]
MTTILDDQLFAHADRARGKVIVLTGGANGIGKEAAILFAKHGAKVVIGDRDVKGAQAVVERISDERGVATSIGCDVLKWEDQVNLFDLAIAQYGAVDIVIPCAGISEAGQVCDGNVKLGEDGRPVKPSLLTLDINLTAVFYTVHLALYYFKRNRTKDAWKSIVLIGSMASWQAIPKGPQYSASKHGILGLMRSLYPIVDAENIRISVIHPWFADTGILPLPIKVILAGVPLTPVPRIAAAILCAGVDPDPATNGLPWLLPDDGPVFRLEREQLRAGVYELLDKRTERLKSFAETVTRTTATLKDLWGIFGHGALFTTVLAGGAFFVFQKA